MAYTDLAKKKANQAVYRAANAEKIKANDAAYRQALKAEARQHYGEVCAHCGYDNPLALVIDHIDDSGAEQRREKGRNFAGYNFYSWLKRSGWPEGYQTLCANCNLIKETQRIGDMAQR